MRLDGHSLTLEDVLAVGTQPTTVLEVAPAALEQVERARAQVEAWVREEHRVIYGVTTGLGKLKDFVVRAEDQEVFQRNILLSHAVGIGPFWEERIVRMAMVLRANVWCRAHSGVRPELLQRLLLFVNRGLTPQVPQVGSLGVGDLQPLAHVGLCLAGMPEGVLQVGGETGSAPDMLRRAGIDPAVFPLSTREALALMAGSTMLLAAAIDVYAQARHLSRLMEVALAFTLEAVRGELHAYDPRIHEARGIESQIQTAAAVRALVDGSEWMTPEGRAQAGERQPRVQDAVSLRSAPQIQGAMGDVLNYIESVLIREINSSTDNPLLFPTEDGYESLSGGNFHGALLAYAMDFLGIVLTDAAVLSERRSARLLDPQANFGLPANLVGEAVGLHCGLALLQANAAALVGEMRVLATPASIGSVPSKGNQEDHNSMGMGALRKTRQLIDHFKHVLAIELLCATQGIALLEGKMDGLRLGRGTDALYRKIRETIPPLRQDRYVREDLDNMLELMEGDVLCTI
ncbi:MAG: aromatic amino acid ammonia-lyase [Tumebacillaceae bacterium]